jgi:hypothetical protein
LFKFLAGSFHQHPVSVHERFHRTNSNNLYAPTFLCPPFFASLTAHRISRLLLRNQGQCVPPTQVFASQLAAVAIVARRWTVAEETSFYSGPAIAWQR